MSIGGAPPVEVTITPEVAEAIYRVLVAFADAPHEQRLAFVHHMSETGTGLGMEEWRIKSGFYGPTCFFKCDNEWYVTTTREDLTDNTDKQINNVNLKLALLKDTFL